MITSMSPGVVSKFGVLASPFPLAFRHFHLSRTYLTPGFVIKCQTASASFRPFSIPSSNCTASVLQSLSSHIRQPMNTNTDPKILIAGAGPTGLILALALRRNGVSVRVIEKSKTPQLGQRGPSVSPRTQEILRALGVLNEVNKRSILPPPVRIYALPEGTTPLKTFDTVAHSEPTPAFPFRGPIWLGQNRLEGILRAALQTYSCEVEFGTNLVSLTQDPDGVNATIEKDGKEDTQRFEFVVGADGARSVVRKQLGLAFAGESHPELHAIIGDIRVEGLSQDNWHMWGEVMSSSVYLRPTGEPNLFGVIMALSGLGLDNGAVMKDPAAFQDALTTVTGRKDLKVVELVWVAQWSLNIRMTEKFSSGRCFLAGDAAHVHSSSGGQGLNSGAQDAFNLAWKLALVLKRKAPLALLNSYDDERPPVIKEMLHATTALLNKLTTSDSSPDADRSRWDRGGPLLMLGVNYRWSSIVVDEQDGQKVPDSEAASRDPYGIRIRGVKAGDRAPDAPELKDIRRGETTRMFDVFDVSRHTVLFFSPSTLERDDRILAQLARYPQDLVRCVAIVRSGFSGTAMESFDMALEDTQGHAYDSYNFEGGCGIAVVRPDGVIGAVIRGPEGVERYFSQIFV
ncbi:Pentachlorophenol 4-monooxygenase [Mycena sanguinolenta]|uniref:Pentachlorophenol 4-monooxygenase n=1 Tax=Mycena sanguinolenta TaxID=230812 RepID=A0A8H6XMF8_9AGAR|nr:Pentachlorophenol 4-monooxygenase [Mycena sanguinolenta]